MPRDSINDTYPWEGPTTIKGENSGDINARLRNAKPKQAYPSDGGVSLDASRKPDQEVLPRVEHVTNEEYNNRIGVKEMPMMPVPAAKRGKRKK